MSFLRNPSLSAKIFLSAAFVAILIGGGIFYSQSINTNNIKKTVPVERVAKCHWPTDSPSNGQQIYRNGKYCFQVTYSAPFQRIYNAANDGLYSNFPYSGDIIYGNDVLCLQTADTSMSYPENPCSVIFSATELNSANLEAWFNKIDEGGQSYKEWVEGAGGKYEWIQIDGLLWLYIEDPEGPGGSETFYTTNSSNTVLVKAGLAAPKDNPLINSLLSDFSFAQ